LEDKLELVSTSKQAVQRAAGDLAFLSDIEDVIGEARNGRMFILVDDEGRENEGDLVIPAQFATPDVVNFMAKHARGLICLALTGERIGELGLELMPQMNASRLSTAFTISIEAREGVTTGISAPDRAHTISVAIDPGKGAADITTPGHIFPLAARDGGVLVRAGHTEAAVDIARLAGLYPAGVICEIMNDDGTMARLPDLIQFAQYHGLKIAAINDLIAYRRRNDRTVSRLSTTEFDSRHGGAFELRVYVNDITYAEHIALVKGDISGSDEPVLVRMHAMNLFTDVLGESEVAKSGELQRAMEMIGEAGRGVIVIIREPTPTALSDLVGARNEMAEGKARVGRGELRDYGIGAQILSDIGVHEMVLLSNTERTIIGLDGYGLRVVGRRPIVAG